MRISVSPASAAASCRRQASRRSSSATRSGIRARPRLVVRRRIESWASYAALSPHELRLLINFHTVSAAVRRRVLARVPFRDVTMGEDILWAREVLEAGYGLANEPASVVEHGHEYGYAECAERNVDDGRANREVVGRRGGDDEVEPSCAASSSTDWHHLRALSLDAHELEVRELEAVLRRCAQVAGQWIGSNPDRVRRGSSRASR